MASAAAIFSSAVIPPSSPPGRDASPSGEGVGVSGAADSVGAGAVSYTHLTLPTILRV